MVDKSRYGVHQTHCCVIHGCKYGDDDCPVVTEEIKQEYTCEYCDDSGIKSLNDLELYRKNYSCCNDMIKIKNQLDFKQLQKFKICPFCETPIVKHEGEM